LEEKKKVIVIYGEGFSSDEIEKMKELLHNTFDTWNDTTILITNKKHKVKTLGDFEMQQMFGDKYEES